MRLENLDNSRRTEPGVYQCILQQTDRAYTPLVVARHAATLRPPSVAGEHEYAFIDDSMLTPEFSVSSNHLTVGAITNSVNPHSSGAEYVDILPNVSTDENRIYDDDDVEMSIVNPLAHSSS